MHPLAYFCGRLLSQQEVKRIWQESIDPKALSWESLIAQLKQRPALVLDKQGGYCQRCHHHALIPLSLSEQDQTLYYCGQCIAMGRLTSQDVLYSLPDTRELAAPEKESCLTWQGQLSLQQTQAANDVVTSLEDCQRPHLIHAVTGAGKTEMLFPVIDTVLRRQGRVAVVSPRVDVCLELYPRLKMAFSGQSLCLLHGRSEQTYRPCDILVATTHQMLRFDSCFDLLIVDEVDAFPYVDNERLHLAVNRAVKPVGKLVFLTATPDQRLQQAIQSRQVTTTVLPARYHGYPLPQPRFVWLGNWVKSLYKRKQSSLLFKHLRSFIALKGSKIVFMANINQAQSLAEWLSALYPHYQITAVHAQDPLRPQKVQAMRQQQLDLLISTSILERGVTFTNCQVFILGAEDTLFSKSALVQMSGRAGRKEEFPTGQVIFGHFGVTSAMRQAYREIVTMNQLARKRGFLNDCSAI